MLVFLIFQYTICLTYTFFFKEKNHPIIISFLQIKFTCNFNLKNFDKISNKYEVITCIKMNKH